MSFAPIFGGFGSVAASAANFFDDVRLLIQAGNGDTVFANDGDPAITLTEVGSLTADADGIVFDGTGTDYFTHDAPAKMNALHDGTPHTIEFFIKGRGDGTNQIVYENNRGTNNNRGLFLAITSGGNFRIIYADATGAGTAPLDVTTTYVLPDDATVRHVVVEYYWHHDSNSDSTNAVYLGVAGAREETISRDNAAFSIDDQSLEGTIGKLLGSSAWDLGATINHLRVTARHHRYDLENNATYTVPSTPFPTSETGSGHFAYPPVFFPEDEVSYTTNHYNMTPIIEHIADGEYVAAFTNGDGHDGASNWPTHKVMLLRSTDYARHFPGSTLVTVASDATLGCQLASFGRDPSSGRLICFYVKMDGTGSTETIFFRTSTDDGATWSAETEVTTSLLHPYGGFSRIVDTSKGLTACFYGPASPYGFVEILRSTDGGQTWGSRATIFDKRGVKQYNETWIIPVTSSDLVSISRLEGSGNNDFFFAKSADGGDSWSDVGEVEWTATLLSQPGPASGWLDDNGDVVVMWADRDNKEIKHSITSAAAFITDPRRSMDGTETIETTHLMRIFSLADDHDYGYVSGVNPGGTGKSQVLWYESAIGQSVWTRLWTKQLVAA